MENETFNLLILQLEGLKVSPSSTVPVVLLLLLLYVFIVVSNLGLMLLIALQSSLHEPMYLLFCNMSFNDVFGATAVIPRLLVDVFTPTAHRYIHYYECIIQAFCAHFYASTCHSVLIIMAFDRYMAICKPLRYSSVMTGRVMVALSAWAWAFSFGVVGVLLSLTVRLSRCRNTISHPFCDNASLFKLSCEDVLVNNIYGLGSAFGVMGCSLCSVALTYLRITLVCLKTKSQSVFSKALQTCFTHLAVYIILLVSGNIIIILHRFPNLSDEKKLAAILFHVVPPSMNSIIYGLQIKAIREKLLILLSRGKRLAIPRGL